MEGGAGQDAGQKADRQGAMGVEKEVEAVAAALGEALAGAGVFRLLGCGLHCSGVQAAAATSRVAGASGQVCLFYIIIV